MSEPMIRVVGWYRERVHSGSYHFYARGSLHMLCGDRILRQNGLGYHRWSWGSDYCSACQQLLREASNDHGR